jgi:D-alanyl-D-alanine carboxypeptidase
MVDERYSDLTSHLSQWQSAVPAPGLALVITDRRHTLYTARLGYADVSARQPVLADTTFQIGSIGKSMTSLALMQHVESGRLDLNAPLSAHLPWFAFPSNFGPVTLRHVMSHTAGLPSGTDFTPASRYEGYALRYTQAAWEPGDRFHYSNTGYKLLGWLLEDLENAPYATVLRRRVLEPVGMTDTDPVAAHANRHRLATGYVPLHDDRPYRNGDTLIPATWMEYNAGDGSPAATIEDMASYARLWLNGGRAGQRALVSATSFQQMTSPVIAMNRGEQYEHDYGYGFGIISHQVAGHRFIGHGGSTVGFRAIMLVDQTDSLAVALLCTGSDVDTYTQAHYALQVAATIRDGLPMPSPPGAPNREEVPNANRYAGDFINEVSGSRLSIRNEANRLILDAHSPDQSPILTRVRLQHISGETFVVPADSFDPFPLRFRFLGSAGSASTADEVHHGGDVYARADASPTIDNVPYPRTWEALPGHYRSHAPYVSNFWIYLRRGRLYLAWPNGGEEPLTEDPLTEDPYSQHTTGWFGVGPVGEPTAERIKFGPVVAGKALRASWTGGGDFYRVS